MSGSAREFALPDLGEGLTEAEIVTWLVAVGDIVAVDQPVVEVETAKAAVEVPSPYRGRVVSLHGAAGDSVAVGAPLVSIDTRDPAETGPAAGAAVPAARPAPTTSPDGDGAAADTSGSGAVLVGSGPTEGARRGRRRRARAADGPRTMASGAPSVPPAPGGRAPVVSPLVRRIAREHGIDAASLSGSGEGGLVLRRDVEAAIGGTDAAAPEGGERVPLRGTHRAMAELVSRSRREIPEATVWVDADASGMLDLRSTLNEADPERPVSVLALLARFCVLGLERFPALNARFGPGPAELVRLSHVNLGVAAQTPRGLVVPVIRNAQAMTARQLSAELDSTTAAARAGSLGPESMNGGTFTVNNYGVFGVDGSAAVINHPEAAIVGMGRIVRRPWVVGDGLAARPVTELTLTFDHRVCDGGQAGGFLRFVADCVERPSVALVDL